MSSSGRFALFLPVGLLALACNNGPNSGPFGVAHRDVFRSVEDLGVSVEAAEGVLQNDEGEDLRVVAVDGETLLGGQVEMTEGGGFTYTPKPGAWGRDEFTYSIGTTEDETATVFLSVLPLAAPSEEIPTEQRGELLRGGNAEDFFGDVAAPVGDVNGDGLDDIVVTAPFINAGGIDTGRVHVIFGDGDRDGFSPYAAANGEGGFAIDGEASSQNFGQILSGAGDMNGDGLADIAVCDRLFNPPDPNLNRAGRCFVVFGKTDGDPVSLSALEAGQGGFTIDGSQQFEQIGEVTGGGDVNGDGFDDLIIGSSGFFDYMNYNSSERGRAYVVLGGPSLASITGADLEAGQGGVVIDPPETNQFFAAKVAMLGDVNGDGLADFAVGAPQFGGYGSGLDRVYVFLGDPGLAFANIVTLTGPGDNDGFGSFVARAGDVNGDGVDDILLGSPYFDVGSENSMGRAHVIFGGATLISGAVATAPDEGRGFLISLTSPQADWRIGEHIGPGGDFDGDGYDDVVVSVVRQSDPYGYGYGEPAEPSWVFVVFGHEGAGAARLDLIQETGEGGFALRGREGSEFGVVAFSPGDVDGDGVSDLLIGEPRADFTAQNAGAAYLLYGLGPPAEAAPEE